MSLFSDAARPVERIQLAPGALLLRGFADAQAAELLREVEALSKVSPFRHLETPGGFTMSVAMTNCGAVGWVSDRSGYRYQALDPLTGQAWPPMPAAFLALAQAAAAEAGFPAFTPDVALVNRYAPGASLSSHRDGDERNHEHPIVSVSLGLPASFFFGGLERSDPVTSYRLDSGDVVVWGGPARLAYHGVRKLKDGEHTLTGRTRINLTFRKAL
ncbi:DNA oxidative demethylase AlkB [bacterium]|nr:DNA oxidative demethylase AlkB [bacterium]